MASPKPDPRWADHFSGHSQHYARYRPRYPEALFAEIAGMCVRRHTALDCATGSGQALEGLRSRFRDVLGIDASASQLRNALKEGAVRAVARAEALPLRARSCDLIVVAQALHWFDHSAFFAEIERIARRGAIFAAWSYRLAWISAPIDRLLERFHGEIVGSYWPPQRALVDAGMASIEIPWDTVPLPELVMTAHWDCDAALGYLGTWSAVQRALRAGHRPMQWIEPRLRALWTEPLEVRWPLSIRVARIT